IYSLLLAWNDYLYQVLLLNSQSKMTVSMMQGHLFEDPDAAWNAMMAAAILCALPPVAVFYALHRYMVAGLSLGGVKAYRRSMIRGSGSGAWRRGALASGRFRR